MGIIDDTKAIADLVKKVGDIDLYRKIVDLQGEITELSGRILELDAENRELKAKLAQNAAMTFRDPYCWIDNDSVPCCPKCWEANQLQIHLSPVEHWADGHARICRNCKEKFYEKRESAMFCVSNPSLFQSFLDNKF